MTICDSVGPFADGELEVEHADEFRAHLGSCKPCQVHLLYLMQLAIRVELAPRCGSEVNSTP